MAFYLHDAEAVFQSDHASFKKLIKNKTKNVLTQNWALEMFSISPNITFQHMKGKDNILADSLKSFAMPKLYDRNLPEKPGEEYGVMIFNEGETIHEYVQPEDFTPPHPHIVTLITDSNNEESVIDTVNIHSR